MWLIAIVLCAQVRFPELPEVVPPPTPRPIAELKADQWYVIESAEPVVVIGSPDGRVKITADVGPMRMKGLFVDGNGIETRTYSSPYIYTVEAASNGSVELLAIPSEVKSSDDVIRKTLVVSGVGPQPPPDPKPDPEPKPPDPKPPGKLMVLVVEETDSRGSLPASQIAVFGAKEIRDFMKSAGELRILDEDQSVSTAEPWIQQAWKEPRQTLPWVVMSNGTTGYSGPLPATVEDMMTLLRRYHADH